MALEDEEEVRRQKELTREFKKQAELQEQISQSLEKYVEAVKDLKHKQQAINDLDKKRAKLLEEMNDLEGDAYKQHEMKVAILEKETDNIKKQGDAIKKAIDKVDASKIVKDQIFSVKGAQAFGKMIGNLDKVLIGAYNKLKSLGLWEMDKQIRQSALEMGVLSKEGEGYRATIKDVAKRTALIGINIKELTELQADFTDGLGRNVMLTEKTLEAMGDIAAATQLGVQGTSQLAIDMENVGSSAEKIGDFVNLSLKNSSKMGLNATKVMKNLTGGMKLLNRYNFKDGTKGLEKMARTVTKLGVDMEFAAGMADKLWDVEGAVDMSAQLQVMGGAFAQMADPFHLMYMARNDINGLTEELAGAAAQSAKFNKETGEFDLGAMEMHRLKTIAEQTGVEYDSLVESGKKMAKLGKIKTQLTFDIGGGKKGEELKEFITNKAFLDEKGKAFIQIGPGPEGKKMLSQLSDQDKAKLKTMAEEEKNAKERAKDAMTFDEQLTNLINSMKIYLMPIVEVMNEKLMPKLENFMKTFNKEKFGEKIEKFASVMGSLISDVLGFIIDNPKLTAGILAVTKIGGFLFEKANWLINGKILAQGFMSSVGGKGNTKTSFWKGSKYDMAEEVATSGGGGGGGAAPPFAGAANPQQPYGPAPAGGGGGGGTPPGGGGAAPGDGGGGGTGPGAKKGFKANWKSMGKGALGALAVGGIEMAASGGEMNPESIGNMAGTILGGILGTALDPFIGPLGNVVGAQLGGMFGGWIGKEFFSDGLFESPVHDANFSKGRGVLQGGKITPIDNKDDLLAMKKGGVVDNAMNQGGNSMRVDFGEITINGKIELVSPGSPGQAVDLLKDPNFRRDITRVVSSEIERNRNGGKNAG